MKRINILLAIAQLEGLNDCEQFHYNDCNGYEPDTNTQIGALLHKYRVSIDYDAGVVYTNLTSNGLIARVRFEGNPNIAVLECILKANKLWQE